MVESINTLRYAENTKYIKNQIKINFQPTNHQVTDDEIEFKQEIYQEKYSNIVVYIKLKIV